MFRMSYFQFGGLKVRAHVTLSSWQIPISPLGMAHLCPHSQPCFQKKSKLIEILVTSTIFNRIEVLYN